MNVMMRCFKFYLAILCAALLLSLPVALFYLVETDEADMFKLVSKVIGGLF